MKKEDTLQNRITIPIKIELGKNARTFLESEGIKTKEITKEYRAGFDCGINGANEENCHFRFFATPEQTKEWERGKKVAETIGRPSLPVPNPII